VLLLLLEQRVEVAPSHHKGSAMLQLLSGSGQLTKCISQVINQLMANKKSYIKSQSRLGALQVK
jgi:hypothetical protein